MHASVAAVHDHAFGSCAGRLIAQQGGLRYVTTHKDAFSLNVADLARVELDARTRRLRVTARRGRTYNFRAAEVDRHALAALEAALHLR